MKHPIKNIAYLTLVAFLLNVAMPFFAVYDVPNHQAAAKEVTSVFGEKLLICTADGFKWVKWEDVQSGKEKHRPPSPYQCALCYLSAHGLKDIATPDTVTLIVRASARLSYAAYDYQPAAFAQNSPALSRAPPSSIL